METAATWVMAAATLVLATATAVLAFFAYRQMKASAAMANEMREQRFSALLPIVDIYTCKEDQSGLEMIKAGLDVQTGTLRSLPCRFRNVGPGPALSIEIFASDGQDNKIRRELGILAPGESIPRFERIWLEETGDGKRLVVRYRDVYGRKIESRRRVEIFSEKSNWAFGPLEHQSFNSEETNHDS